jgi:hypothetical protein
MKFTWSEEKNTILKEQRGISFEQVVEAIGTDDDLDIIPHNTWPRQIILVVRINGYVCKCPAVPTEDGFFLKTVYQSRKLNKKLGGA